VSGKRNGNFDWKGDSLFFEKVNFGFQAISRPLPLNLRLIVWGSRNVGFSERRPRSQTVNKVRFGCQFYEKKELTIMGNYDNEPEVKIVKQRIAKLGLSLDPFIKKITHVYKRPKPIGFRFVCENPDSLFVALQYNPNFGMDNPPNIKLPRNIVGKIAAHFTRGTSFREVSDTDSLHLSVSKKLSLDTLDNCEIHLDTTSISSGVDDEGMVIYNLVNLPQHLVTDLLEKPNLIAHNEGEFFNVGWRF
jgi:hypothetical protein